MIEIQNKEQFTEEVEKDLPNIIYFTAPWCGPCRTQGPIMEELSKEYPEDFSVLKVDVDKQPELAGAFQIRSIPTIMFVKDPVNKDDKRVDVVESMSGRQSKKQLIEKITKYFLDK